MLDVLHCFVLQMLRVASLIWQHPPNTTLNKETQCGVLHCGVVNTLHQS